MGRFQSQGSPFGSDAAESRRKGWFFLLISVFLWMALGLLGFAFFLDFSITETNFIPVGSGLGVFKVLVPAALLLLGFSALCGAVLALPSLMALSSLRDRVMILHKRARGRPMLRLYLLKHLPWLLFIFCHGSFLLLSLASAPPFARGLTQNENVLSRWSQAIYEAVFYNPKGIPSALWERALGGSTPKLTIVVALPASLLSENGTFRKLERDMGGALPIFVESLSAQGAFYQFFTGHSEIQPEFAKPLVSVGAPWNVATSALTQFAPEAVALEASFDPKQKQKVTELLSSNVVIQKRLVLSQPHLYLLARWEILSLVNENWKWTSLIADDLFALQQFAENLAVRKDEKVAFIQLSGLEKMISGVRSPFSPLRWKDSISAEERALIAQQLETYLLQLQSEVRKRKRHSLILVPYPDQENTRRHSRAFVSLGEQSETDDSLLNAAKESGGIFLLSDLAAASGIAGSDERKILRTSHCLPIALWGGIQDEEQGNLEWENLFWSHVQAGPRGFEFPFEFGFVAENYIRPGAFCGDVAAATHSPDSSKGNAPTERISRWWLALWRSPPDVEASFLKAKSWPFPAGIRYSVIQNLNSPESILSKRNVTNPRVARKRTKINLPLSSATNLELMPSETFDLFEFKNELPGSGQKNMQWIPVKSPDDTVLFVDKFRPKLEEILEGFARGEMK
jgi:hypothetical protein